MALIRAYGTYIALIGLPGAGKTFTRTELKKLIPALCIVSSDDYVEAYAQQRGLTYAEAFPEAIDGATQTVNALLAFYTQEGMSIIHDQTNLSAKKRKKVLKKIPDGYEKIAVLVETDEITRQQRLQERTGKIIPALVDAQMRESFKSPSLDEGWDIITNARGAQRLCSHCTF